MNVTNIPLKEVNEKIKELRKKYRRVNLKSRGTKNGRMTFIVYY